MSVLPFLKWAGGKRQILPELCSRLPKHFEIYFEPFLGGGSLFFHLEPKHAVLSDTNWQLIATYRAVRDDVEKLIRNLRAFPREKTFYLWQRARKMSEESDIDIGARFIYINRCGFNGLWRENSKGECNVPFGSNTSPICEPEKLRNCSKALKNAKIEHVDFEETSRNVQYGDFVYFDPPYIPVSKTSNFTQYNKTRFTIEDHVRLRNVACNLKDRGATVLLSNSNAPEVYELYKEYGFCIDQVLARRSINSNVDNRAAIKEVIIQ